MAAIETPTQVHVDDEWRRWIAENLLLDSRPQDMYERLLAAGIGEVEALNLDTYADPDRFFSYRRATHRGERDYGRQLSAIGIAG